MGKINDQVTVISMTHLPRFTPLFMALSGGGQGRVLSLRPFCAFFNRRTFARFTVTGWARDSDWPAADTLVEIVLLGLGVRRAMQAAPVWEYMLNDHYCLRVVADQTRLKIEPTCTAVH